MLRKFLLRLKPGASQKTHLLLAAFLWTCVGGMLCLRGTIWLFQEESMIFILPAVVAGSLKSLFILDKSAKKGIDRIAHLADNSCLGGVYSVRTWLLVIVMVSFGYLLRKSTLPLEIVGLVYVIIGWALLFSSRSAWLAWKTGKE